MRLYLKVSLLFVYRKNESIDLSEKFISLRLLQPRGAVFQKISEMILKFRNILTTEVAIFRKIRHTAIHSGYFNSASSSPLLLRSAPDTA